MDNGTTWGRARVSPAAESSWSFHINRANHTGFILFYRLLLTVI